MSPDLDPILPDSRLCAHCGYNLRGLPPEGKCPECGTPIARSLHGNLLSAADPAWLQRIYRGQTLIYVGCVGLILGFVFNFFWGMAPSPLDVLRPAWSPVVHILLWVTPGAASLLVLLGAFATTTLDPRLSLTEQPIALRRFVRWSIVALVALEASDYVAPTVVKQLGADADVAALLSGTVFELAPGLPFLSGLVGICYYLAGLAMRIPDSKLASRTKTRVFRFLVCVGIVIAVVLVGIFTPFTPGSAPTAFDQILQILASLIIYVAMWYIFLLMILMSAYRKAFRKCLLEARKHAAA